MLILPISSLGVFTYYTVKDHHKKEIEKYTSSFASLLASQIDLYNTRVIQTLKYILSDYQKIKSLNRDVLPGFPYLESLYILNREGIVEDTHPYNQEQIGVDFSKRIPLAQCLKEGGPIWSETFISTVTGNLTFPVAIASKDKVIVGFSNLSYLMSTFNLIKAIGVGELIITDAKGTAILHPDPSFVQERRNLGGLFPIEQGLKGREGFFNYTDEGKKMVGSVVRIPKTSWVMLFQQPEEKAFALQKKVEKILITSLLIIIGITIIAGFFGATRLGYSLKMLLDKIKALKEGKIDDSHPTRALSKEIDEILSHFSETAETIRLKEESLQAERERFLALSENAPFGMMVTDQDGGIKYINPKFIELFGYDLTDIPDGRTWFRKAYPDPTYRHDVIKIWVNDLEGFKPKEKRPRIFTVTCKDGTEKTINFIAVQLESGENLIVCEDITERKRAEEALRQERERFSTLVESIPFGITLLDRNGDFSYINKRFKELFGYDISDIPDGRTWFRKAYPEHDYRREVIKTWIEDAKHALPGIGKSRVFTVTCKDGTKKITEITTVFLEEDKIIVVYEDITEHKRTEEQLLQAQKMEAIGRLAGGIAHDFNNMLTVILGHTQLALLGLDSSHPLYHRFKEIQRAAGRSAELTRNLLAFARKQTIMPRVINLNATIEDMFKMIKRLIGENIELLWIPGDNIWQVKMDPAQLNQIVINIVINAKDAIQEFGTITIETDNIIFDETYCKGHLGFTPGEYVMLAISDNGTGMEKEVFEHLFEPFFTTKAVGKGSGLGLSTVYGIVKQNNGFINVYSEPNKGSTFKIYIPRFIGDIEESRIEEDKPIMESKGETILVVEDEKEVLELCTLMLTELGYKVLSATRPQDAIKEARYYDGEIHLLVTDVVMPGMNGRELAEQLKTLRPSIRTLFMSGYTTNAIVHNGILKDNVDYIQKPFSIKTLSIKVREVLDL